MLTGDFEIVNGFEASAGGSRSICVSLEVEIYFRTDAQLKGQNLFNRQPQAYAKNLETRTPAADG
jgi:hypothetical protein